MSDDDLPDPGMRADSGIVMAGNTLWLMESYETLKEKLDDATDDDFVEFLAFADTYTEPGEKMTQYPVSYRRTAIAGYFAVTDKMWDGRVEAMREAHEDYEAQKQIRALQREGMQKALEDAGRGPTVPPGPLGPGGPVMLG